MITKKRNRSTKVCDFCKRRKVKCNLGNPCSTCIKYGNTECRYNELHLGQDEITNDYGVHMNKLLKKISPTIQSYGSGSLKDELDILKEKIQSLEKSVIPDINDIPSRYPESNVLNANKFLASKPFESYRLDELVGFNPIESSADEINFFDGYTPLFDKEPLRRKNCGPLSFLSIIKLDSSLSKMWEVIMDSKKTYLKQYLFTPDSEESKTFRAKLSENEGYDDVRPFSVSKENHRCNEFHKAAIRNNKLNIREKALTSGLIFYEGDLDEELDLIKRIQLVLPKKRVIWKLFNRFFQVVYPNMCFIDQEKLQEQIESFIGPESYEDEPVQFVKLQRRLDFAYLGQLLIVLRFSYLTLFTNIASVNQANLMSNDPSPGAQEKKYLLSNPVNIEVIKVAQLCLNQFNLFRSVNFAILQLAMCTRMYHQFSPEDGDGYDGGDSHTFTAMIIQMCYSMGLHREPNQFLDQCNDEKTNNLGRKLWFTVIRNDLDNASQSGLPLNISVSNYDTKPPYFQNGNSNVRDIQVEKRSVSSFENFEVMYENISHILNMISDVRGRIKLSHLTKQLSFMESHYIGIYGQLWNQLDDKLSADQVFFKTLKIKIYFKANFLMVSLSFYLFNYYERKVNTELSFYYLKKIFAITIYELLPFYYQLLKNSPIIFQEGTDLFVTPGFEQAIHKSMVVLTAVYIRVKSSLYYLKVNYNLNKLRRDDLCYIRFEVLTKFLHLLDKCLKEFLTAISRLSHRYYHAWRVTKLQHIIYDVINKESFYENFSGLLKIDKGILFSNAMIEDLISIIEISLAKISSKNKSDKPPSQSTESNSNCKSKSNLNSDSLSNSNNNNNNNNNNGSLSSNSDVVLNEDTPSTSRGSFEEPDHGEYSADDQIDSLWLKLMSMKSPGMFNQNGHSFDPSLLYIDSLQGNVGLENNGSNLFADKPFESQKDNVLNADSVTIDELFKDLM